MSPEEREMINGVFERMRSVGQVEKDRDAETFINTSVRKIPDSAYMLVQSVLVQEQALQQADERIRELEDMVAQLQQQQSRAAPAAAPASGGFLGGLFGGSKAAPAQPTASPWGGSVPQVGRQSGGYAGPGQAPQQGGYNQAPMLQQAPQSSGGGFMKSAMTTAAGVAGGMLVAGAIGNMMRGNQEGGTHTASGAGRDSGPGYQDASANDQGGTYAQESQAQPEQPQYQDANNNDQGSGGGVQDAGYDDGGGDWGSSGGDIET